MQAREMSKQQKVQRIERFIRGAWSSASREIAQSLLEQVNGAEEMVVIRKLYKEAASMRSIKHNMTLFGYVGNLPQHAGGGLGKLFRELYPDINTAFQAAQQQAISADYSGGF